MGPSPTLVRTGLRTPVRPGWRSAVAGSLVLVASRPSLWLFGALGFLVRGGLLLLILPILVLPTPVALRVLIGDNLTSSGFSTGFYLILLAGAAVVVALVLLGLLAAAQSEIATFSRLSGRDAVAGRSAVAGVFAIQLFALVVLAAAALPLVFGAVNATYSELVRPTLGAPLYERVLGQLGGPLYLLLTVLVIVEAATAVATRRLLAGVFGLRSAVGSPLSALLTGLGRPVIRPLTTLGTALLGWLASIALLLPAVWALDMAWRSARGALLAPARVAGGEEVGALVAVLLLCGVWLAALCLAGFAAALRAALWTSEELR